LRPTRILACFHEFRFSKGETIETITWADAVIPCGGLMKCQLGNASVYYESCGDGRPLIALHGFGPDHRLMKGCLEPVFRHRTGWMRVYPDLPGMGKTKGEEWIVNSDKMVDVVLEFIEKWFLTRVLLLLANRTGDILREPWLRRDAALLMDCFWYVH
jgi:hypothetical protein